MRPVLSRTFGSKCSIPSVCEFRGVNSMKNVNRSRNVTTKRGFLLRTGAANAEAFPGVNTASNANPSSNGHDGAPEAAPAAKGLFSAMLLPPKIAVFGGLIAIALKLVISGALFFVFWTAPITSCTVVVVAEACFAVWWWRVHSRNLARPPDVHSPPNHDPERAFSRVLALATLVRDMASKQGGPNGSALGGKNSILGSNGSGSSIGRQPLQLGQGKISIVAAAYGTLEWQPQAAVDSTMRMMLSWWFSGVDFSRVRRGNVAELLAYAFYYKSLSMMESAGLGHVPMQMVERLEEATGNTLPPGYQEGLTAMFHLWEPLRCSWRPLAFYLLLEVLSLWTYAVMTLVLGFRRRHETPAARSSGTGVGSGAGRRSSVRAYTLGRFEGSKHGTGSSSSNGVAAAGGAGGAGGSLPGSPPVASDAGQWDAGGKVSVGDAAQLASSSSSASNAILPPILILHGVGFGLLSYLPLISRLTAIGRPVICMKIRHVSMQLTRYIPMSCEVAEDVIAVLDEMGVEKVCVVAHSYGTFVTSLLAQRHPHRLHSTCLIDPVCFGVFMPNLLGNFVYRHSHQLTGSGIMDMLMWFISRDVHVAATFGRRFYWSDVNLWAEEIPAKALVVISGKDDLIHVNEVRHFVQACTNARVLFHPDHTHAGCLLDPAWQDRIVQEIAGLLREDRYTN